MNELPELSEQDQLFIELLIENGGNIQQASQDSGHHPMYGYKLRRRLAKHIIAATQDYFAVNAIKAASKVVSSIDETMPNSTNLAAALALLDRVGITKKDLSQEAHAIKANIFILPAKDDYETTDC